MLNDRRLLMEKIFTKIFYKKKYKKYKDLYTKMSREELDYEHAILRTHLFYSQCVGVLIAVYLVPMGIIMSHDSIDFGISWYLYIGTLFFLLIIFFGYSVNELKISIIENIKSRKKK
jgi:hypothetical protein